MIEYKEEMTHFYIKNNKDSPRTDWALWSQSLTSYLRRVPFNLKDKKMGMGYGFDHLSKGVQKKLMDKKVATRCKGTCACITNPTTLVLIESPPHT